MPLVVADKGSIPACAGEPAPINPSGGKHEVYPRVCGGTRRGKSLAIAPRRSIPACAGEPHSCLSSRRASRVYPRVCGGTSPAYPETATIPGLSPRVRGNLLGYLSGANPIRSIPACAGEPMRGGLRWIRLEVYPRVCGGTVRCPPFLAGPAGLSPRVRGNRGAVWGRCCRRRSIPACAGEPDAFYEVLGQVRVYPRVCGGTGGSQRRL